MIQGNLKTVINLLIEKEKNHHLPEYLQTVYVTWSLFYHPAITWFTAIVCCEDCMTNTERPTPGTFQSPRNAGQFQYRVNRK